MTHKLVLAHIQIDRPENPILYRLYVHHGSYG
ncbi:hypothetical protein CABS01_16536 [Colletotrichum abscissum]|nr:uncharacterized protein CABS01_16536 [Colletotrichum abscissum]KAK1521560.1 hypothetical protein CABS01_16536 [Colletotrichum abscissum]